MSSTFTRTTKTLEEVLQQCKEQSLDVDTTQLGDSGYITVRGGGAFAHYNPATGNFIGTTPDGEHFHAKNTAHARKHWFVALMNFFGTECV